jgi:hypothetical protein
MMTLEQRARQAAEAVQTSTAAYEPMAGLADVARRTVRRRAATVAVAGMAVFAALVAGSWISDADREEVAEPPPSSTPSIDEPIVPPVTALPAPDGEVVPDEQIPGETPIAPEPEPEPDPGSVALPPVTQPPIPDPPTTTAPPETATTVLVDATPPALAITFPTDGERFDRKTIRFAGTTEPGAIVSAGRYEATVDDEGNWALVLVLSEGGNRAKFLATDAAGNETTVSITVYYDKPAEEPPPSVEFTAHATYGSCSFDPPYDVYYGTAEPGSKVTISSEYGGATVYANDDGQWEKKVYFPEAPSGVPFLVTVKDRAGNSKKFEFVSLVGV